MALIELNVELSQIRAILERIATALERLAGPAPDPPSPLPPELQVSSDNLTTIDEEFLWEKEQEQDRQGPISPTTDELPV